MSTDRTALVTYQSDVSEFVEALTDKFYELCHHHFINEAQSSYLTGEKATLDVQTCLILIDFAENYSFLVQDAIQGFYWQNEQATLHPFAVYYKDKHDELRCDCYCVISDHLHHDQTSVHCFLSNLLPMIRSISVMGKPHSTKITNPLKTSCTTRKIIILKLNTTSLLHLMVKAHAMEFGLNGKQLTPV